MMEKTLILKHISRMLCLLISYSKFTRTRKAVILRLCNLHDTINLETEITTYKEGSKDYEL